jgi:hypothetical protein
MSDTAFSVGTRSHPLGDPKAGLMRSPVFPAGIQARSRSFLNDFYTPMETRIAELRGNYAGDAEASAILDQHAEEPEIHRRHSDFYAYEFFVARRALGQSHPEMTEDVTVDPSFTARGSAGR